MSFVSKGIKKAWGFVKEHWVEIAIVAAIVFTAGVATVGFGAFAAATEAGIAAGGAGMGFGGFMGAVGTTMWAGVAGAAGSMGIGAGATVPTTTATIAAGTAGTNVGLGAAWGAGAGFTTSTGAESSIGWDASGKITAATLRDGSTAAYNQALASGATKEAARKSAADYATRFTTDAAGNMTKAGANVAARKAGGGNAGLEVAKAWGPTIAGTVGPALVGLAGKEDEGGAPIWGSFAGGSRNEKKQRALADIGAETPDAGGAPSIGGANQAAENMQNAQVGRANMPLMGNQGNRGPDGRLLEDEGRGLMGRYGGYGYA